MEAMVSSLMRLFIVSITVLFVNKKKKQALDLFRFNGKSAESFGNWERNLSLAALAMWEI